ncbi:MAG: acyl-CoA dehydrogenase family protein [Ilumatobacteraceae bacterium]
MVDRLEALRAEVRDFLRAHSPPADPLPWAHAPHDRHPLPAERAWTAALRDGRWLCLSWPEHFGGRGLSPLECSAVNEAFAAAGAPRTVLGIGERLVAPTLLTFGTPDQQQRFLPSILSGQHWWCQGFSEPEAGSDLASLRTRAEVSGDELVITGQKVWTSEAQRADWILLLCRTGPLSGHRHGLTLVAVPSRQPGVEIRPLRQAHGGAGFNEVFFDGARARVDDVIGGLDNGWLVATATLASERGGDAGVLHVGYEWELRRLIDVAHANGAAADATIRQGLAASWTAVQILRVNGLRQLARLAGSEDVGPLAALHKVLSSEHHREFGDLALRVRGADAMTTPDGDAYTVDEWQRIFFESRSRCISRGTNEIQRNIIAERLLGLPRERPQAIGELHAGAA